MADSDSESSSFYTDEEAQEEDLRQLKAVLEADQCTVNERSSQASTSNSGSQGTPAEVEYENVQTALSFNKLTDEKLRRLEKVLISRLRECRQRLSEIHDTPWNQKIEKQLTFRYVFCGKPYFRDKNNFTPPDNNDTLTMEKSGMFDFSDIGAVAGWTVKDKTQFLQQILKLSRQLKKEELESQLAELRRKSKRKDSKVMQKDIVVLQKQIDAVKTLPLSEESVLPLDKEYDWDSIADALNYRHTAEEYRALWKLFLHPSINKKCWDKTEHAKLIEIVMKNRFQDWEKIAEELNTGRTGYQCFVYYRTNMGNSLTGQKWTKEEEEYLKRLIDYYREDNYIPWGKIAASMENRTKIQIYNKYFRLIELRKGRFLPEEDSVLLTSIEKFGLDFKKITKYLPGRSVSQLRMRHQILNNSTRTSIVWTVKEDRKLIQLMANQDSSQYINYASITKFFPDKDRAQLRARYVTLVRWMKKHPNKDISNAPRRGARRLIHGKRQRDLNEALENLKKRIKTEIETKKSKKITKDSSDDVIDHAIITTLINENLKDEMLRKQHPTCTGSSGAADEGDQWRQSNSEINLRKILILLKSQLNKDKFQASSYASKYTLLQKADLEPTFVKVKSYSRKAATESLRIDINTNPPDIWGTNKVKATNYILPPNYSTITGCRRLMALASNKFKDGRSPSLQLLMKRNILVKEQLTLFLERFNILFSWPMLLSNEGPREDNNSSPRPIQQREILTGPIHSYIPMSVIIPRKEIQPHEQDEIDLSIADNEYVTVLRPLVGEDDFIFMEIDSDETAAPAETE